MSEMPKGVERVVGLVGDYIEGLLEDRQTAKDQAQARLSEIAGAGGVVSDTGPDRERERDIVERPLDPNSLVGSWFHRLEDDRIIWQGCVVAEVQAGVYLLELHNWRDGASAHQRLATIQQMTSDDEEWRFYDADEWMKMAGLRSPAHEEVDKEALTWG